MGKSPSQFEETIQHQFDRLCKLALKGEKIDYIRHIEYLRKNEVMLSELSQKELDQLATHDEYDLESYKFQVLNYDIEVNEHRKRSLEILKDVMEEKADESEM